MLSGIYNISRASFSSRAMRRILHVRNNRFFLQDRRRAVSFGTQVTERTIDDYAGDELWISHSDGKRRSPLGYLAHSSFYPCLFHSFQAAIADSIWHSSGFLRLILVGCDVHGRQPETLVSFNAIPACFAGAPGVVRKLVGPCPSGNGQAVGKARMRRNKSVSGFRPGRRQADLNAKPRRKISGALYMVC